MRQAAPVITRNEAVLGGEPVSLGSRVMIRSLFEYLEAGETLDAFLEQFPDVHRDQVIALLEEARRCILSRP